MNKVVDCTYNIVFNSDLMNKNRLVYIDFLRFVGITAIILAHVNAPDFLVQFRCFDVPLMLFVSGLSYANKNMNDINCRIWMFKRLKRLIIPVWLYLVFFFVVYYILRSNNIIVNSYSTVEIIGSFFLLTGRSIGYVWIYKVFILIMFITPFLLKNQKKLNTNSFFVVIIFILLINELLLDVFFPLLKNYKGIHYVLLQTVPYMLAYSVPFLFGVKLRNSSNRESLLLFVFFFLLFSLSAFYFYKTKGLILEFHPFFKYPPRLFFISYGLVFCSLLWLVRKYLYGISEFKFVSFVGSNTTWIYLFHILIVTLVNIYVSSWWVRFLIVYFCSIIVYRIWYIIINALNKRKELSIYKYLIG